MKRTYVLVGIAVLQIIVGSFLLLGAAQPIQVSEDVIVHSGTYYHFDFGILGAGRLSGNLSEFQNQSFALFVFDDPGFASFRDGSNTVPPLFERNGTRIVFDVRFPSSGQYHLVAAGSPATSAFQLHVEVVAIGLKTNDTILAIVVLVGGLALMCASLMLSVWAWRRAPSASVAGATPDPSQGPSPDPSADSSAVPPVAPQNPLDDTRIY